MATTGPRFSNEEFAARGGSIYEHDIRPKLKPDDDGKFVAIDIESGAYEVDEDEITACDRLRDRVGDAQVWLARAGQDAARRFITVVTFS